MPSESLRALVVDDDAVVRRMLCFALQQEGFNCDLAKDGVQAVERLAQVRYDLVVTDLRMPNKHGHSLAVELLADAKRPVVMIHTSVDEPRMTKDLLTRGVDDIVYKPTNYKTFAARAKIVVAKRKNAEQDADVDAAVPGWLSEKDVGESGKGDAQTEAEHDRSKEARRVDISDVLPISQAAISVYELTTKGDVDATQIAEAIERDASLAAEMLVLGNSAHYNPAGNEVAELEPIVVRVGRRRVGELALATSARASVRKNNAPWVDWDLVWRRSVAAGLAVEVLTEAIDSPELAKGLYLTAIFHPLGRIVLASVFPDRHEPLSRSCLENSELLSQAEQAAFGRSHTAMMAELLNQWKVPQEITLPLTHAQDPYDSLDSLSDIDRKRVELLKVAIFTARIAVARWQPIDLFELPPLSVIEELKIPSPGDLVERTRRALTEMLEAISTGTGSRVSAGAAVADEPVSVGYHRLSPRGVDWLATALPSMGFELKYTGIEEQSQLLVNCLDVDPSVAVQLLPPLKDQSRILIAVPDHEEELAEYGRVVSLPCSYGRLRQSLQRQTAQTR